MNAMESLEGLKKRIKELESEVNEIKSKNERQERILSSLDTGLSVINVDFTISWANQKIREMFPDAEPIGQICHRFYESSDVPCDLCPTLQCFKSGGVHSIEKYNSAKEGWYSIISQPVKDSNGEVISVLEGITDITERKEEEKKIYQERSFLKQLLEISPVAITLVDRKGYISMANARAEEVLGLKRSNIYSRRYNDPQWHITDFEGNEYPEEQLPFQMVQKKAGPVFSVEHAIVWPDGKKVLLSINAAPVYDSEGNFTGMISAKEDITERKKAEQQVQSSLKEKEVLLQELYHRTKNNMQTIVAMINMQTRQIEDEYILQIFKETKNRIIAMALVHEKLYQSKSLSRIDLKTYFTDLLDLLVESYPRLSDRVEITTDIQTVYVPIDTAIPCGLIMNELISNAFQHAFPDDRHGEIQISLKSLDSGEVTLTFSDNGVGLPDEVDFENAESMGLKTILALAEHQLSGNVKVSSDSGTQFSFTFKMPRNNQAE